MSLLEAAPGVVIVLALLAAAVLVYGVVLLNRWAKQNPLPDDEDSPEAYWK